MRKYRWGIIGTGKIANRFAEALNNIPEEAELTAIGSRNLNTAKSFAEKYNAVKCYEGYENLAADPEIDVVYIATPGRFHYKDVSMMLEAGKRVLCEKSITMNGDEAEKLINTARSKGLFLMEAMWTRFFPLHIKIRELLASNVIGDIRGMYANFSYIAPEGSKNRFWNVNLGASSLIDIGAYGISFASSLFGKPEEVTGIASIGEEGFDYQNSCIIKYKEGRIATIVSSQVSFDVKTAVIFGTGGKISINEPWYKPTSMTLYQKMKEPETLEFPLGKFNGLEYEIREVMSCIDKNETESKIIPLDESLEVMRTLDRIRSQWGFKFPFEDKTTD